MLILYLQMIPQHDVGVDVNATWWLISIYYNNRNELR